MLVLWLHDCLWTTESYSDSSLLLLKNMNRLLTQVKLLWAGDSALNTNKPGSVQLTVVRASAAETETLWRSGAGAGAGAGEEQALAPWGDSYLQGEKRKTWRARRSTRVIFQSTVSSTQRARARALARRPTPPLAHIIINNFVRRR